MTFELTKMALSSEEAFFLSNPAPSDLATVRKTVEEFIELHRKRNKMVSLVTVSRSETIKILYNYYKKYSFSLVVQLFPWRKILSDSSITSALEAEAQSPRSILI